MPGMPGYLDRGRTVPWPRQDHAEELPRTHSQRNAPVGHRCGCLPSRSSIAGPSSRSAESKCPVNGRRPVGSRSFTVRSGKAAGAVRLGLGAEPGFAADVLMSPLGNVAVVLAPRPWVELHVRGGGDFR